MTAILPPEFQAHLKDLMEVAGQLEARRTLEAKDLCHDCNDVIWDLVNGCPCDTSAGVLGAARKLLSRGRARRGWDRAVDVLARTHLAGHRALVKGKRRAHRVHAYITVGLVQVAASWLDAAKKRLTTGGGPR